MDYLTLRKHINEISNELSDKPVLVRACEVAGKGIGLILKRKDNWTCLVLQLNNSNQGLWLDNKWDELDTAGKFCQSLNRLITNGRIGSINFEGKESQGQFDRVLSISWNVTNTFFGGTKSWSVICEFTGNVSNIFVCDEDKIVIDSLKKTTNNSIGSEYSLPDSNKRTSPFNISVEALNKVFLSPESEWKNLIGGFSPLVRKEILFRKTQHPKASHSQIFLSLINEYTKANKTIAYVSSGKLKAISQIELQHLKSTHELQSFQSVNETLLWVEKDLLKQKRLLEIKNIVVAQFKKNLKFKQKQLNEQNKLLVKYGNSERYQNMGNLILANLHKIPKRATSVTLPDWETGKDIEISLNPHKTLASNAQRYFHLCKKGKRGIALVKNRINILEEEIKWQQEQIWLAENAETEADLQVKPIDSKKRHKHQTNTSKKKQQSQKRLPPGVKPLLEINGCKYYVGKNGKQNDIVTFKIGKKGDQWFHANNIPGAHVILKKSSGEITDNDIHIGAVLAGWFSFAKDSSKIAVDTTDVKNVKKIPKGGPGRVSFTCQTTIYVNPQEALELGFTR